MKKKILITGASGDIAQPLISTLLEQNYEVIGLDIKKPKISGIKFYECDLSNLEDIERFLNNESYEWINELDSIVHLAGMYPNEEFSKYSISLWRKVQAVNVESIFFLVKKILQMEAPQLKSIVLVSSTAAKIGSKDPAYTASKAALNGLARSLSLSLAEKKIRVNTVLPGIIDTSMSKGQTIERKKYHVSKTLANDIGTPEEVANVIAFLISDQSSYIWGASINVNGGMTV